MLQRMTRGRLQIMLRRDRRNNGSEQGIELTDDVVIFKQEAANIVKNTVQTMRMLDLQLKQLEYYRLVISCRSLQSD